MSQMTDSSLVHFVPANREAAILDASVSRIFVVAHEALGSTNHWSLYLQTSSDGSVHIDCQPSHSIPSTVLKGGSKANLIISELPTKVIDFNTEAQFVVDVEPGLSVRQVYDCIVENGRHKYEFDENGVGCRNWVTDQLDLFYQAELLIDDGQIAEAKAGILTQWPSQRFNPLDKGAYYP